MKTDALHREAEHRRTFAFVFESDEDPVALLGDAATEHQLASWVLRDERRQDSDRRASSDVGVRRVVFVHCVVGMRDGSTRGGHLLDARVWPTLEVIVSAWPAYLRKRCDPDIDLAPVDPPKPEYR